MPYTAIGVDVSRNRDATLTITANVIDDATQRAERVQVTGASLEACKTQLQQLLQRKAEEGRDSALKAAVVGQVLASTPRGAEKADGG